MMAGRGNETMKVGTVLIAAAIAGVSLPALGQTNDNKLTDCVRAADQKYKDVWKTVCAKMCAEMRTPDWCSDFVGSPPTPGLCSGFRGVPVDKEFSQLRIEEMTLCAKLYGR
jgi:hypothetical protein